MSVVCLLLASGWAPAAASAQASEPAVLLSEGDEEVIVFEELEDVPLAPQASTHESLDQRAHFLGELGALAAADLRDEGSQQRTLGQQGQCTDDTRATLLGATLEVKRLPLGATLDCAAHTSSSLQSAL